MSCCKEEDLITRFQRLVPVGAIASNISPKTAYLLYRLTGLIEETGELAGKIKRMIRDKGDVLTEEDRQQMGYELGDMLWYYTELAQRLGFTLEEIMELNLKKRSDRQKRGVVRGSGDKR